MLCRRVILLLTFNDGVLFRTKRFVPDYRYTQAYSWSGDADEIMLIDVTPNPTPESREKFIELDRLYCHRINIPQAIGGHVDSVEYAKRLINNGSEAVVIGWKYRSIYEACAKEFGSQAVVAGIHYDESNRATVSDICRDATARGAGEILLTSVDRDGSLAGYDLPCLQSVADAVSVPVVVAGGCGNWQHMREAFEAGAAGAATSNIFHLNETAMRACKQWLAANYDGPIRPAEAG